jgi:hypothetical protein
MNERTQPVVAGVSEKGELVWKFIPMPFWQMAMFPLRYMGDFTAYWQKVRMLFEYGIESDEGCSADFRSFVPWQMKKKYAEKRRIHKGD